MGGKRRSALPPLEALSDDLLKIGGIVNRTLSSGSHPLIYLDNLLLLVYNNINNNI